MKGVANYRMLLKQYGIENIYEDIYEGLKSRVVYVKNNIFGIETITFQRWPKEFDKDIEIDYEKMIEKFFLKKIGFLLEPMNRSFLLDTKVSNNMLDSFFM